jgi:3',5'-cyclic-AMP phosphodiesterase
MTGHPGVFAFAHIGDLHLEKSGDRNAVDLREILAEVATLHGHGLLDFAYLPGDIAERGEAAQYDILWEALKEVLKAHPDLPVRPIAGDHDRQCGKMADFETLFRQIAGTPRGRPLRVHTNPLPRPRHPVPVNQYYYADTFDDVRCLFLDMVSAGYGEEGFGLDFRLGPSQRTWIAGELAAAARQKQPCAVFTHTYPDDLRVVEERAELAGLIRGHGVRLVEMGHTHYNELAHDGRTLYASARSVGQNEDGSVGYAVAAIDGAVTSWRFKPLDRELPFVMITSPADRRLATAALDPSDDVVVRALVLWDAPEASWSCQARVDGGPPHTMKPVSPRIVQGRVPWPDGSRRLSVTVTDARGRTDTDTIEPVSRTFVPPLTPDKPGSDAFRTGAWPEKGIRGDQLGPNRNGRHW